MVKNFTNLNIIPALLIMIMILFVNCSREKSTITGTQPQPASADTLTDKKPNIYFYPDVKTELKVEISFPMGGRITASEPAYPDSGWDIAVDTDGMIDDTWPYLFYECKVPDNFQTDEGWLVPQSNLTAFFESVLKHYNLNGPESADFIEYWLPLLNDYDAYLIYPQRKEIINQIIALDFSIQPDNIFRIHFLFQGIDNPGQIAPNRPVIRPASRSGFTIIEWGGIVKN